MYAPPFPNPQDHQYDYSADAWGLGVMLYELACGSPPFYANSINKLLRLIVAPGTLQFPNTMSEKLV